MAGVLFGVGKCQTTESVCDLCEREPVCGNMCVCVCVSRSDMLGLSLICVGRILYRACWCQCFWHLHLYSSPSFIPTRRDCRVPAIAPLDALWPQHLSLRRQRACAWGGRGFRAAGGRCGLWRCTSADASPASIVCRLHSHPGSSLPHPQRLTVHPLIPYHPTRRLSTPALRDFLCLITVLHLYSQS